MKLDATTRSLQVLLSGTVSTTACDFVVCYRDENRNAPQNLGAVPSATFPGTVSSATAVTLLAAPSVNTIVRVPERISFKNRDTTTVTPTFRLNDNATTYQFWSPALLTGESAFYDEGRGWYAVDANGNQKESLAAASNWAVSGNLTVSGNTTLGDAAADSLTINAGVLSAPNIPAFLAYKSASSTNATGNNANFDYVCDTEIVDQGANYNAATGVFTAPVTGLYWLTIRCLVQSITTAMTLRTLELITSNRTYTYGDSFAPPATASYELTVTVLADMDAGDTAFPRVNIQNGAGNTATVYGGAGNYTMFCGGQKA